MRQFIINGTLVLFLSGVAATLFILVVLAFTPIKKPTAYEPQADTSVKELKRLPNPNAAVDAVIASRATDATVPSVIEVYLVPHGKLLTGYCVFRAMGVNAREVWIDWSSDYQLVVSYKEARLVKTLRSFRLEASGISRPIQIEYQAKHK